LEYRYIWNLGSQKVTAVGEQRLLVVAHVFFFVIDCLILFKRSVSLQGRNNLIYSIVYQQYMCKHHDLFYSHRSQKITQTKTKKKRQNRLRYEKVQTTIQMIPIDYFIFFSFLVFNHHYYYFFTRIWVSIKSTMKPY
jgi:hypothetical protein